MNNISKLNYKFSKYGAVLKSFIAYKFALINLKQPINTLLKFKYDYRMNFLSTTIRSEAKLRFGALYGFSLGEENGDFFRAETFI